MEWRRVLESLDVAVVVADAPLGTITYANAKAASLLGLNAEDIVGRTTDDSQWDAIDANGNPVQGEGHPGLRAMRTAQPVNGQVLGVRVGEADRVWILISAVPEFDETGLLQRVVITFSDVTAMQREVRAQTAIYRTVFSSMSEGLAIHAADGSILAVNASAERVLGLTEDQMAGRAATDPRWRLVREDGGTLTASEIPSEIALKTGAPVAARVLGVHRPTGETAWLAVRADPLREDDHDQVVGAVATFADVTREIEAQRALAESQVQSQRILDAVPGVVYQYRPSADGPGELVIVGGNVHNVLGVDVDPATIGMDLVLSMLGPEERERVLVDIGAAVREERNFEYTSRIDGGDGAPRWIRAIGRPERTARGLLYTGVFLDATAEVQLEEALRRSAKREWMGEMSAGIAHNFNNMLEVILPNVEMARELLPPGDRELLDDAERAAVRAADLVRRMMELGRSELGTASATCDLVPVVREAMHLARSTMDPGIRLEEVVRVESAIVRGRASSYQQVLLNLLFNARDALRDAAVPYIYVGLHADGPNAIRLEVRDNGHGIPEQVLPRLGEPFFTTKGPSQGTGLGLASVVRAVEEAGGKWDVQSRVGAGATFTIHIPTERGTPAAPAVTVSTGTAPQGGAVLIVDDEEMVRDVLSRQVARAGLTPRALPSAEEAIEYLLSEQPTDIRAIILDLSMPGLSGARALPILKALLKDVPVIIVSGHAQSTDAFEGAAAVLQKPLGFRDLQATLARVLNRTAVAVA
jgi:two-component system, cell cycle sensor histidine kinase and response regulator CckA